MQEDARRAMADRFKSATGLDDASSSSRIDHRSSWPSPEPKQRLADITLFHAPTFFSKQRDGL